MEEESKSKTMWEGKNKPDLKFMYESTLTKKVAYVGVSQSE